MDRIEDRSKALSYIGIEVADALKVIPTPVDTTVASVETNTAKAKKEVKKQVKNEEVQEEIIEPEVNAIPKVSLWQKIKNSKIVRTISYIMKIRVVIEYPALPEGRGE